MILELTFVIVYIILLIAMLRIDWYFTKYEPPEAPSYEDNVDQFTLKADEFLKMFPKTNFKE